MRRSIPRNITSWIGPRRYQYRIPNSPRGSNCASCREHRRSAIGLGAELQPRAPRDLHLRKQSKPPAGLVALHTPEIQRASREAESRDRAGLAACRRRPSSDRSARESSTARCRSTSRSGLRCGESGRMPDRGHRYADGLFIDQKIAAGSGSDASDSGRRARVGPAGLRECCDPRWLRLARWPA